VASTRRVVPPTSDELTVGEVGVGGPVRVHDVPEHPVGRMDPDRCPEGAGQVDGGVDVVVVAVRGDDGHGASVTTAAAMGRWSWAASMTTTSVSSPTTQMLLSTSKSAPSREKVPEVTTRSITGFKSS